MYNYMNIFMYESSHHSQTFIITIPQIAISEIINKKF